MQPMSLAFEERGSGPTCLFIHGFPLNRTMWIPQLAGLAKKRTCVAVDLRGHGLSTDAATEPYSMDLFADDVAATLDTLKADQVDLCGLSMGGYVALAFWRRHRDRVRSLIMIDTKAEADSDEAKTGRTNAAKAVVEDGMAAFHAGLGPKLVGDDPIEEATAAVERMFLDCDPEVAAADLLAMRDRPDSTADLEAITVPTLWIHGEQDKLMSLEGARADAGKIPNSTFVAVPNAGHMSNIEQPAAVNEAIAAFLG